MMNYFAIPGIKIAKPRMEGILLAVNEVFPFSKSEVFQRCRRREYIEVRQIIQYLYSELLNISQKEIGKRTGGFNHCTIVHSIKCIRNRMAVDKRFRDKINSIKHRIP